MFATLIEDKYWIVNKIFAFFASRDPQKLMASKYSFRTKSVSVFARSRCQFIDEFSKIYLALHPLSDHLVSLEFSSILYVFVAWHISSQYLHMDCPRVRHTFTNTPSLPPFVHVHRVQIRKPNKATTLIPAKQILSEISPQLTDDFMMFRLRLVQRIVRFVSVAPWFRANNTLTTSLLNQKYALFFVEKPHDHCDDHSHWFFPFSCAVIHNSVLFVGQRWWTKTTKRKFCCQPERGIYICDFR